MSSAAGHFYTPSYEPFHIEKDSRGEFRVWETALEGKFIVSNSNNGSTYRGNLEDVVRFIERERRTSGK